MFRQDLSHLVLYFRLHMCLHTCLRCNKYRILPRIIIVSLYFLQGNIPKRESPILIKFSINVIFKKIFDPYFFLSEIIECILPNISELLKIPFLCKLMKFMFFNDECNDVYHFAKKRFV